MKLLHWNVHMWQDVGGADNQIEILELVEEQAPDVVSLVEVDEPWGAAAAGGARRLADELGYSWIFIPTFEYRGAGGFGNALLSSHPVLAVQQWGLLTPRLYDGTEPSEPRSVLLAQVDVDGSACWVGSTHFPRSSVEDRAQASDRLLQVLDRLSTPWAVCGDFNQPAAAWVPPHAMAEPADPTYPAAAPVEAIDYCLIAGAEVDEAQVISSADGSDHLPVVIDIRLH